jgi:hypothetical protein
MTYTRYFGTKYFILFCNMIRLFRPALTLGEFAAVGVVPAAAAAAALSTPRVVGVIPISFHCSSTLNQPTHYRRPVALDPFL